MVSTTSGSRPLPSTPGSRLIAKPEPAGRGLSGRAGVLLALALAVAGAAVDLVTARGLGAGYAAGFAAGCTLAVLLVRRQGLRVVVFAPPLIYAGVVLAGGLVGGSVPRTLPRQSVELLTQLIVGAPVLVATTVLVLLIARARGASPQRRSR